MALATGIMDLFPTPLLLLEVPEAARLNAALKPRILARRAIHAGLAHSNFGGWHSDTELLQWGGSEAGELVKAFLQLASRHSRDLASPDAPRFDWGVKMWANVSERGAANAGHAHPGAFWSGVYYVDDGAASGADASTDLGADVGGELCLVDPRYPLVQQAAPDVACLSANGTPLRAEQRIKPQAGLLVAFPSWLQHMVRPYRGAGTRISIAINLSVVPRARALAR